MNTKQIEIDTKLIKRCIELSQLSVKNKESPFGSVIAKGSKILVESENKALRLSDASRHAEIEVMTKARQLLGTSDLSGYTIYSNYEPCVMCSFLIREYNLSRVVFATPSFEMGGFSRWNVLQATILGNTKPFSEPPIVIPNLLAKEAEKLFVGKFIGLCKKNKLM